MEEKEYNEVDAIRFSRLKLIAISPLAYHVNARRDSSSMALGRAAHCRILTPDAYNAQFCSKREGLSLATKEGKAWKAEQSGREILSADDDAAIVQMHASVMANDAAERLISGATRIESPTFWTDDATGLACKAKPDLACDGWIADLKTARDVTPRAFARQAASLYYHAQLAFYAKGRPVSAALIAVQSVPPYDCVVYHLSPGDLQIGWSLCRRWLDRVKECADAGEWPGVAGQGGELALELPAWAMGEDELDWGTEAAA